MSELWLLIKWRVCVCFLWTSGAQAALLQPTKGHAQNQLGVVAHAAGCGPLEVYRYVRSLESSSPFPGVNQSLAISVDRMRKIVEGLAAREPRVKRLASVGARQLVADAVMITVPASQGQAGAGGLPDMRRKAAAAAGRGGSADVAEPTIMIMTPDAAAALPSMQQYHSSLAAAATSGVATSGTLLLDPQASISPDVVFRPSQHAKPMALEEYSLAPSTSSLPPPPLPLRRAALSWALGRTIRLYALLSASNAQASAADPSTGAPGTELQSVPLAVRALSRDVRRLAEAQRTASAEAAAAAAAAREERINARRQARYVRFVDAGRHVSEWVHYDRSDEEDPAEDGMTTLPPPRPVDPASPDANPAAVPVPSVLPPMWSARLLVLIMGSIASADRGIARATKESSSTAVMTAAEKAAAAAAATSATLRRNLAMLALMSLSAVLVRETKLLLADACNPDRAARSDALDRQVRRGGNKPVPGETGSGLDENGNRVGAAAWGMAAEPAGPSVPAPEAAVAADGDDSDADMDEDADDDDGNAAAGAVPEAVLKAQREKAEGEADDEDEEAARQVRVISS
jgi:hypothetical protein